jgi:hypothetical protein
MAKSLTEPEFKQYNTIQMNYWTQNPEVLTQIGFEAKIFKFDL